MRAALALVLLLGACRSAPLTQMRVIIEPPSYSAAMSSKLGMELTAVAEHPPGMQVRYLWKADAGFFLVQDEKTARILDLGRQTVSEDVKMLWSYDPAEPMAINRAPVSIAVVTATYPKGVVLAQTDITLEWDGAVVRIKH